MAHEDRRNRGHNEEDRQSEQGGGRRRERLGDRHNPGLSDDPDHGAERYGAAPSSGYGSDDQGGPMTSDPGRSFTAPGIDPGFGGPRFDRTDVGSTGTHGVHPVSSAFGSATVGASGGTSSARRNAIFQQHEREQHQGGRDHDPHYTQWRSRQMEQLDRDYEDYSRERQSSFERDFGEWRERRGRQRQAIGQVREHMEVVGSDDQHVGTVDGTRGDSIVLTRSDPSAGGNHHSIPCAWIDEVDSQVRLNLPAEQAMERWRDEERSQALFDREQGGSDDDRRG